VSEPHVGVGALVRRGADVLLARRHGSHGAGTWSPPGGYLDFGEDPAVCAVREVREETGVDARSARFVGVTNDVFGEEALHFVTLWFELEYVEGEPRVVAADELSEVRWFSHDALPQPLFLPFERFVAGEILRS